MRIAASAEGFRFSEVSTLLNFVYLVLFGGVLAFIMEVFEFFVVTEASSLTLSVVGIFKVRYNSDTRIVSRERENP